MNRPPLPSLRFNDELLPAAELGDALARFRRDGFAVIEDVFDPAGVGDFRAELGEAVARDRDTGRIPLDDSALSIWPTRAPRLRQVLAPALDRSALTRSAAVSRERSPALFEVSWRVQASGPRVGALDGWHRDRDQEGTSATHYAFPREVHVLAYFEDMQPELGPTQAIARSHTDRSLSPFDGAPVTDLLPRSQDIVLFDQRLWHRATRRTVPGNRVVGLFGFYAAPARRQRRMSAAQREAWQQAGDDEEQVLYGGVFSAPEPERR